MVVVEVTKGYSLGAGLSIIAPVTVIVWRYYKKKAVARRTASPRRRRRHSTPSRSTYVRAGAGIMGSTANNEYSYRYRAMASIVDSMVLVCRLTAAAAALRLGAGQG